MSGWSSPSDVRPPNSRISVLALNVRGQLRGVAELAQAAGRSSTTGLVRCCRGRHVAGWPATSGTSSSTTSRLYRVMLPIPLLY